MKTGKSVLWKKILRSPVTLVVIVLISIFITKAVWNIYAKAKLSEEKLTQSINNLDNLKVRQSELSDKIKYLSTDEGVESEIRTKYHAVKEGEAVAIIVEDKASSTDSNGTSKEQSWLGKILDFFGL